MVLTLFAGCSKPNNPKESTAPTQSQAVTTASSQQTSNNTTAATTTPASTPAATTSAANNSDSTVYKNTQYGFNFTLPASWKGYSIVNSEWQGTALDGGTGQTGPMISIRDPKWTSVTPRQDIPIMILTLDQWNLLQQEKFHIGAAPINPTELGRNNKYVFALPARYNYAFPPGFEEVETILKGNPLKATQVK
jgi:hypothetical protein